MESDKPDCHQVIPRHPKPRADKDPPDPDPDDPDADDHNDPDDLPNISTFIFTQPRTGAQYLTEETSTLNPAAKRTEEKATGKSNIGSD